MLKRILISTVLLAALFMVVDAAAQRSAPSAKLTGGNGTLYIGGWPNRIFVIDEATEKVTGTIEVTSAGPPKGGPPRSMVLSKDKKRFYLTNSLEDVEILDIATRKSIDRFSMSEGGNKRTYIRGMVPDPLDRFLVMVLKVVEKKIDRYEIAPPKLVVYDLKEHKISRTVPWPNNEERENVNVMFSPDGKLLYFFGDEVLIYDTTDFKQVDTWDLARPIEEGFGRFDFGPRDATYEEPGFYSGIFMIKNPVLNRDIMGVGRVNLTAKSFEWWPVGPAMQLSVGGEARRLLAGARPEARLRPAAGDRPLRVLDVRSRETQRRQDPVRGAAAHGAADEHERQAALRLSGRRHDRLLRREQLQAAADPDARRRPDDRSHRRARRQRSRAGHAALTVMARWNDG